MSSCGAGAAVRSEALTSSTAMVLLPTGELREYPQHAKAARALEDAAAGVDAGARWVVSGTALVRAADPGEWMRGVGARRAR